MPTEQVLETRYAYYRRCHVFRRNGEQCKAPAEKGSYICHAHAGQLALAVRRERERRTVLAEAVAEMRRKGRAEFEMADLFMDFKGIQVTLGKMAQALIDGRIDCKTAGRLVVQLQMASKVLWMVHRKGREGRKEKQISPQISADERRLNKRKELPELFAIPRAQKVNARKNRAENQGEETRIALVTGVRASEPCESWPHAPAEWVGPTRHQIRGWTHGPPECSRAA